MPDFSKSAFYAVLGLAIAFALLDTYSIDTAKMNRRAVKKLKGKQQLA